MGGSRFVFLCVLGLSACGGVTEPRREPAADPDAGSAAPDAGEEAGAVLSRIDAGRSPESICPARPDLCCADGRDLGTDAGAEWCGEVAAFCACNRELCCLERPGDVDFCPAIATSCEAGAPQ